MLFAFDLFFLLLFVRDVFGVVYHFMYCSSLQSFYCCLVLCSVHSLLALLNVCCFLILCVCVRVSVLIMHVLGGVSACIEGGMGGGGVGRRGRKS